MGANQKTDKQFYSITSNGITRQFKNPDDDTVSRVNKEQRTVHEKFYNNLTGFIVGVAVRDNVKLKAKELVVSLKDGEEHMELQMGLKSSSAKRIICSLDNVDPKIMVSIAVTKGVDDNGRDILNTWINQDVGGERLSIKQAYKKADMPAWKETIIDGEKKFDRTDELKKLVEIVESYQKNFTSKKMVGGDADKADFSDYKSTEKQGGKAEKGKVKGREKVVDTRANDNFNDSEDLDDLPF